VVNKVRKSFSPSVAFEPVVLDPVVDVGAVFDVAVVGLEVDADSVGRSVVVGIADASVVMNAPC